MLRWRVTSPVPIRPRMRTLSAKLFAISLRTLVVQVEPNALDHQLPEPGRVRTGLAIAARSGLKAVCGRVEIAARFPLSHNHDDYRIIPSNLSAYRVRILRARSFLNMASLEEL